MTKIEWTQATWNPLAGCSIVSPGCTNCYAMKMAARLERMLPRSLPHYAGLTRRSKAGAVWTGKVALATEGILRSPLARKKPTLYFVNSMSDLFHEDVPDEWIDRVFSIMAMCPQHTFQVLTKRSARMREYLRRHDVGSRWAFECLRTASGMPHADTAVEWTRNGLPNVWLGVSCEDQKRAEERVPDLLATPAAVRFVSAEPLLGAIDFTRLDLPSYGYLNAFAARYFVSPQQPAQRGLDWVIVGGESGPGARPMHPDWARLIRDQCESFGTAFFFKQWGEHEPIVSAADMQDHMRHDGDDADLRDARRKSQVVWPDGTRLTPEPLYEWWANLDCSSEDGEESEMKGCAVVMRAVGKKVAGRLLDGREHNDMPRATTKITEPA